VSSTSTKHTPGPWTVEYSTQDGYSVWYDPRVHGDMRRGAVVIACDFRAGKEARHNALLTAAGPDMLAALEKAVWELVEIDNAAPGPVTIGPEQRADLATAINAARAAIAKARGKEPAT
jgi:hypothetical protein